MNSFRLQFETGITACLDKNYKVADDDLSVLVQAVPDLSRNMFFLTPQKKILPCKNGS